MSCLAIALPFDFAQPQWLWLVLLVPLMVVASIRNLAGLDPARRILATAIRCILLALIALCLAGIERVLRNEDLTVFFLMDRSHSVRTHEESAEQYVREAADTMSPHDRLGLIDFARHAFLEQLPMEGGFFVPPGRLPAINDTDRTDLGAAVRLAMAMFPHDTSKRIVLLSDGNDNMGDVLSEIRRAGADGIPIDVVPLRYEHANEVYFDRMIAPTYAEKGEQVPIRMILRSHRSVTGKLSLSHNGQLVALPPEYARVSLRPGTNTFFIKLPVNTAGTQTYEATFHPDDNTMDGIALNNKGSAFSFVAGSSPALLITSNPAHEAELVAALRRENVNIVVKSEAELGDFGLLEMMNYSTILLSNVAAAAFTDDQQQALAAYVKDVGSGLLMLGGPESFGAGGWIGSPVEEVMPVSFEIKHKRVIPRGALVLIMHSCEVPRGNFYATEMAKKSVDTISSQDYIGVVAYTYSPGGSNWEVPLGLNTNRNAVKAKIDRIQVGDMPDFGAPMEMAYRELVNGLGKDAAQKHIIMFSDGDPQAPPQKLINDFVAAKITISTIGIGWGAHVMESTMRNIAQQTGGRYYAARNPNELPQIFAKESKVVRRPLIIEEPFQPQIVDPTSDLLGGIAGTTDSFPPLGGMVLTSVKSSPHVVMPMIRATDDGEDPVLAHWQYELGKTVVFTSGYWPAWGKQWTSWPRFAKFFSQMVRWTMRQETPANFDSYTRIEGNRGWIVIDALDKNADYLNDLQLRTKLIGPDNAAIAQSFKQTGPGHYEAEFDVEKAGQYLANVQIFDGGNHLGTLRTGMSVPFSPEFRDLSANESMLRQVVEVTGGRWLDGKAGDAKIFEHNLPPSVSRRPAWDWMLAWLFLPAFLLDVAVRRLASWLALSIAVEVLLLIVLLFGFEVRYAPWWGLLGAVVFVELVGWTIRFRYIGPLYEFMTHGVTALSQAGQRSEAALEKLKTKREQVKEELSATSARAGRKVAEETDAPIAPARAKRKFEAAKGSQPSSTGNLAESLGGAKTTEPGGKGSPPAEPDAGDESATSRLLRAKKRARDETEPRP